MEFEEGLERIRDLIEDGKAKLALRQLKALYDPDNPDLQVMLEIANGMAALTQWGKARAMIGKAIEHFPQDSSLWVNLSYFYCVEESYGQALEAIEIGLSRHPHEIALLSEKAQLLAYLGKRDEMHQWIDGLIASHPQDRMGLLVERAAIYESLACTSEAGEATVCNGLGMHFEIHLLEQAIRDLDRALMEDGNWRIFMKRAKLNKDLQQFDAAIVDYDRALQSLDEEGELAREFIEQERDGCLNGGLNERQQMADVIRQGMDKVDDVGELSREQMITNNVIEAMASSYADGEEIGELLEEIGDDPEQMLAMETAQEILKQAREPSADLTPTNATEFAPSAQKYCARVEKMLVENDFQVLGDFEPKGLSQHLGSRFLLRIFLSNDQAISAAAFEVKPLKPKFLLWLLLVITGQWKTVRTVELVSETTDGKYIITNNSGDVNPFTLEGDFDYINLPCKTSIDETVASHIDRLLQFKSEELVKIEDVDQLFEQQERLRVAKNAYRESLGFITDEELKKLLGKQYGKYADHIRKYLRMLGSPTAA